MREGSSPKSSFFLSTIPFRPSMTALGLLIASILLAGVLALSTLQNINRAEQFKERFLLQKGDTVIRAVRAALRTTAMHHMTGEEPLQTLLAESSRENNIAYIVLFDHDGTIIAQTEHVPDLTVLSEIGAMSETAVPRSSLDKENGIFTVTRKLDNHPADRSRSVMPGHRMHMGGVRDLFTDTFIIVGLYTAEFDEARKQDVRHALFMGAILFLVGGAGLYLLFMSQGMRVARKTLANMKLYTNNIVESIPLGIITLDKANRVVSCNHNTEEIIGRPAPELRGATVQELFPDCPFDARQIRLAEFDRSIECETSDGRHRPLELRGSSLQNIEGDEIGSVLVVRDMTLIKDMERQLERSRRMAALGKMAAGIAHEIRNPLGTLKGFAHYFRNLTVMNDEGQAYADLMISEVDRLNKTVSGLLQFARPRAPHLIPVSLDELFERTLALMTSDFTQQGVAVRVAGASQVIVEADPELLQQVLMNLLKNSIDAMAGGGTITLSVQEDTGQVRIRVSDTGCGMSEQDRERMFDPFFTTKKTGTGLGLAVSHQIVEQHGGSIDVETASGRGTTITINLPKQG
ncbi:two-component system sensor histidine kinase NtrB [Desulfofustis limnaeus]|jgi:two-component system sensor histidine kinase HydH|uniref:histidine kinase n=1 Tax=Desulfofustis limnaeus TaxID=2740163 RepID=A0ABN6M0Z0_9BACT|nr:ATP-binding protein [Desulfofustis limnaeus]MDX9894698.1 ATP-binding protein [Desulfofustis sp.]BDD85674.1 hypothetical protein DPPLL_00390 [Desulfofustis limnaeus]